MICSSFTPLSINTLKISSTDLHRKMHNPKTQFLQKSLAPFAISLSLIGSPLPEENQKKYAEADARFRDSPALKQLLEKSKLNKEKNKQQIQDKYCLRGAEWGVGDCSAEGMSPKEREDFIAMLKQKTSAGANE